MASILATYIGKYVSNLNKDQLKVSIWHGDVCVRNLELKSNALDSLRLPVSVHQGLLCRGPHVFLVVYRQLPPVATDRSEELYFESLARCCDAQKLLCVSSYKCRNTPNKTPLFVVAMPEQKCIQLARVFVKAGSYRVEDCNDTMAVKFGP